jgi:hypothetical protein
MTDNTREKTSGAMRSRVLVLGGMLFFATAGCERAVGITSAQLGDGATRSAALVEEPGELVLHQGAKHRITIKHQHLWVDAKDLGAMRATDQAKLKALFLGQDSLLNDMRTKATSGLAKVRDRRGKHGHGPYLADEELWLRTQSTWSTTQHIGVLFSANTSVPLTIGVGEHTATMAEVSTKSGQLQDYCSQSYDNMALCYYFALDFQSLQDRYVQARHNQSDALAEWLSGEGTDVIEQFFEQLGDEAPEVAMATAIMQGIDFFLTVKDEYASYLINQMLGELNTDVWIGNTWGVFSGDWSIDCKDQYWDENYTDICVSDM